MDELDAATLAAYRSALAVAAEVLNQRGETTLARDAAGATSALFAAIERREARERDMQAENVAMREIVQFVAGCDIGPHSRRLLMWQFDDADVYVEKARALLKGDV